MEQRELFDDTERREATDDAYISGVYGYDPDGNGAFGIPFDCMRRVHTLCTLSRASLGAKKGCVPGDKYLTKTTYPAACGGVVDLSGVFELSVDAYYAALHAYMSELPVKREISRFVEKVRSAGTCAANGGGIHGKNPARGGARTGSGEVPGVAARAAADRAASDRGDPDVMAIQNAAWKVRVEIHRLTGLLRFRPEADGIYVARCSPDYYVLPALAEHFTLRFGEIPWAIIDEKRGICLCRPKGGEARLVPAATEAAGAGSLFGEAFTRAAGQAADSSAPHTFAPVFPATEPEKGGRGDTWEDLWRLYHRSINNETRENPRLQRQFMPERYHKYLTELN